MPEAVDMAAWIRLGKLLERRRVCMDPRYSNLSLFAEERGINYRMAWDAEQAQRTNYRSATRLAIDVAYGWEPGSVDAVLAGGEPEVASPRRAVIPADAPLCTFEQSILGEASISDENKGSIIRGHRAGGHISCRPLAEDIPERTAARSGS
jgi:hypothetical protein